MGCGTCGGPVPARDRGRPAVYCSQACRARAYRARKAGRPPGGGARPARRPPDRDEIPAAVTETPPPLPLEDLDGTPGVLLGGVRAVLAEADGHVVLEHVPQRLTAAEAAELARALWAVHAHQTRTGPPARDENPQPVTESAVTAPAPEAVPAPSGRDETPAAGTENGAADVPAAPSGGERRALVKQIDMADRIGPGWALCQREGDAERQTWLVTYQGQVKGEVRRYRRKTGGGWSKGWEAFLGGAGGFVRHSATAAGSWSDRSSFLWRSRDLAAWGIATRPAFQQPNPHWATRPRTGGHDETPQPMTEPAVTPPAEPAPETAAPETAPSGRDDSPAPVTKTRPVKGGTGGLGLPDGYAMVEDRDAGRAYLTWRGRRVGYAVRRGGLSGGSGWTAHTADGTSIPGASACRTRAAALTQVAAHHRRVSPAPTTRAPGLPDGWSLARTLAEADQGAARLLAPDGRVVGVIARDTVSGSRPRWTATSGDPAQGSHYIPGSIGTDATDPDRADEMSWWTRTAAVRALATWHDPELTSADTTR